jgi:hypothetical protein
MRPPGAEPASWYGSKKMHEPRASTCRCGGLVLATTTLPATR